MLAPATDWRPAHLSPPLWRPELTQSRAQLAASWKPRGRNSRTPRGDLVRVRSLAKTRTVSDDDLRDAIVRRDRPRLFLQRQKRHSLLETQSFPSCRVTAPEALIVVKRLRDPGDLAGPALPILEVESAADLRFEAWLPQAASTSLHAGMPATLVLDGHELLMDVRVSRVLDSADPLTRTHALEVDLPAGAGLMAGTYGEIRILQGEVSTTVVPARALIERAGVVGLFVLDEGELAQNARVHYRSVRPDAAWAGMSRYWPVSGRVKRWYPGRGARPRGWRPGEDDRAMTVTRLNLPGRLSRLS